MCHWCRNELFTRNALPTRQAIVLVDKKEEMECAVVKQEAVGQKRGREMQAISSGRPAKKRTRGRGSDVVGQTGQYEPQAYKEQEQQEPPPPQPCRRSIGEETRRLLARVVEQHAANLPVRIEVEDEGRDTGVQANTNLNDDSEGEYELVLRRRPRRRVE